MVAIRFCECEQNYSKRHCQHIILCRQKNFEKIICKQSKNSSYHFYCTTDIHQKIREYADLRSNLLIQFQLLQPNVHGYEHLLQVVLSTIHESALAKPAMLDFCLQLYANNNTIADIRNFAEKYQPEDSIDWYTRESFVYRCVNKTLRLGDIDKCYSLRFYIADLSDQLHTLKDQQQEAAEKVGMTILYRGIRQSDEQLKILQTLIGQVVAVKSFMSTSRNRNVALTYACPEDRQTEDSRAFLLEIHVDLSSSDIIAADITRISNFNEEAEVLFNIGSTFRIDMLTYEESGNIWLCRFIATNENLAHTQQFQTIPFNMSLCKLISYGNDIVHSNQTIRHEQGRTIESTFESNDQQKLSWLAYRPIDWAYIRHIDCFIHWQQTNIGKLMSTCERALEIYAQVDVKDPYDDLQIASCMNNIGYINLLSGKHTQLIDLFKGALNIRQKYKPPDDILLTQCYRNLGLAYEILRDYRTAFEFHERALSINQHASITAQWSTVTTLRNMGHLYHHLGNCTRAVECYSKAIDTYYKCLNFFYETKPELSTSV